MEAGFGHTEQCADEIKPICAADEGHSDRANTPGRHDAGKPTTGAEAIKQQIGRHFAHAIAKEEQACSETKGGGVQAERLVHLKGGEANVHTVEIGNEIAQHDERHDMHGDPPHGAVRELGREPAGGDGLRT